MGRNNKDFEAAHQKGPYGTGPHGGDLPTDFPNDNGYGTHEERPGIACSHCPAKFHFAGSRDKHEKSVHNGDMPGKTDDMLF